MEIGISCKHRRKLSLASVIEDMARNAMSLSICKLITHTKRRASTLTYQYIALAQPGSILVIDFNIPFTLLLKIKVRRTHMLSKNYMLLLHILDHPSI